MSKKILIVEDDLSLASALRAGLEDEGFNVIEAHDGGLGLKMVEDNLPNLIICDIAMPKMDGLEMLAAMRKTSWGKSLSVFMLTNFSDANRISTALSYSSFRYFVKSDWDLSKIIEEVKKELKV
ncbi:response regulator [Candidatus Falkowbacteria bacterium]|nr:response regulator [Candidatus Falkowbacteria bacterium]